MIARIVSRGLLAGCLLTCLCVGAVAEVAAEHGVTTRDGVLRAAPSLDGAEITTLSADTRVAVRGRERLWMRVTTLGPDPVEGWLRVTEVRLGAGASSTGSSGVAARSGFAGLSRSVTGLFERFGKRKSSRVTTTSTIGVRGIGAADLETARPDHEALARVERIDISIRETVDFAKSAGLRGTDVPYLDTAGVSDGGGS